MSERAKMSHGVEPSAGLAPVSERPRRLNEANLHLAEVRDADSVLRSAVEEFAEKGFRQASVREIAWSCGLTTGAIYSRWADKRELFLAAIEHVARRRVPFFNGETEATATEKLTTLAGRLLLDDDLPLRDFMTEAYALARRDGALGASIVAALRFEVDSFAGVLEEGKAAGLIDESLCTDAMVALWLSLVRGMHLVLQGETAGRSRPIEPDWCPLIELVIAACAPPQQSGAEH